MPLVRPASVADARAVAELLALLGYPTREEEIRERLPRLVSETACIVVAELDGRVLGLATAHVFDTIHLATRAGWLTALVVHDDARRRGIGRTLNRWIEVWARSHGCAQLGVLTGIHRLDAHALYEALGYERTGHRYTKDLTKPRDA